MTDEQPARNRKRDFWTLDVPLALVLILCATLTFIEVGRAGQGNWRAWVYSFEWPLIGAFAIWIWYRFRTEGNPARKWRERVARYEAEIQANEQAAHDPGLRAWREYVADLESDERPQQPPTP